jgi:hypothetical protein
LGEYSSAYNRYRSIISKRKERPPMNDINGQEVKRSDVVQPLNSTELYEVHTIYKRKALIRSVCGDDQRTVRDFSGYARRDYDDFCYWLPGGWE